MTAYSDLADIWHNDRRKGNCDHLLAAMLTIVEAGAREINDSRHKLPSWSVVRAHKQLRLSELE